MFPEDLIESAQADVDQARRGVDQADRFAGGRFVAPTATPDRELEAVRFENTFEDSGSRFELELDEPPQRVWLALKEAQ